MEQKPSTRPPIDELFQRFQAANDSSMLASGEVLFALTNKWFVQFKKAAHDKLNNFSMDIRNKRLIENGELRPSLLCPSDYILMKEPAFNVITSAFQVDETIKVPVFYDPILKINVPSPHAAEITVFYQKQPTIIHMHIYESFCDLKVKACAQFGISSENVKVMTYWAQIPGDIMKDEEQIISQSPLKTQSYLLESSEGAKVRLVRAEVLAKNGKCGILNSVNKCYFNAVIQCLAQTRQIIIAYSEHSPETNDHCNALQKEFVTAFSLTIKQIWNGSAKIIDLKSLTEFFGRLSKQFVGDKQQDSHECLMYILDILHLATNRGSPSSPDPTKSEFNIDAYRLRDDSQIFETFQGFIKATYVCPICHFTSTNYDQSLSVSVPITKPSTITIGITFIPYDINTQPTYFTLSLSPSAKAVDIKNEVCKAVGKKDMTLAFYHKMNDFCEPYASNGEQFIAYEVDSPTESYVRLYICLSTNPPLSVGHPILLLAQSDEDIDESYIQMVAEDRLMAFWDDKYKCKPKNRFEDVEQIYDGDPERIGKAVITKVRNSSTIYPYIKADSVAFFLNPMKARYSQGFNYDAASFIPDISQIAFINVRLEDCLAKMVQSETLDQENQWECPRCQKGVCAERMVRFSYLPKVLILHLMRFLTTNGFTQKNETAVDYPDELDMGPYMEEGKEKQKYRLYAVVEHSGNVNFGHYMAICKIHNSDNKWFLFDDSRIEEVSKEKSHTPAAYILLYEQV